MQDYVQLLARQDIEAKYIGGQALILTCPVLVDKIPGFTDGIVSVQDLGAQLAAYLLDAKASMNVLDACCAPGGKTGHILELSDVVLTALDSDKIRLQRVESNLSRMKLQANLLVGDASLKDWVVKNKTSPQYFDRILADVPCSASGIVRRHVDIKWLRRESDVVSFASQQAKILANLWQMLVKGGKLLYVTCSVFNEENQGQVDNFLKNNADAIQLPFILPDCYASAEINQINGQLIPTNEHDGFFYALLQKN
jgi:16S rRNA (cytosine967-C5)-methyltransferase